jgi:hypothetical protein
MWAVSSLWESSITSGVVHLQGGVVDVETLFEEVLQPPPLGVVIFVLRD